MSVTAENQKTPSFFDYFILLCCLLVPFINTVTLFVIQDYAHNDALVFGAAAGVYFSVVTLGLFNVAKFKKYGRAEFWILIVSIVASSIGGLLAVGGCIISCVGLPYIC